MLTYRLRFAVQLAALCVLFASTFNAKAADAHSGAVTWQPTKLVGGSPVLFHVSAPAGTQAIRASWLGHEITFFRSPGKPGWYALAGVPVETSAGAYELKIREKRASGEWSVAKRVGIGKTRYLKIPLHVAKAFTEPNPEQLKQITTEKTLKQGILSTESPERLWTGNFEPPVTVPTSDVFGTERVFNGEVKSRHLGLDYAAPAETPVRAINRGIVLLARPLFFEGGFVVIDHGQGILSLYLHLSDFKVKEGDTVDAGQVIALSGGSGRATGPHLHLAVRWQGVYVNPAVLLALKLP